MSIKSILLEATEYADGTSLVKAILRGQVVGISKRFFNSEEPDTKILDKFLQIVKTNFDKFNVSFSDFRVNGYYDKLESFTIKVNKELVNAAIKEKKEELEKTKALIRKNTK